MKSYLAISTSLASVLIAAPVVAQDVNAETQNGGLLEIIVTAQKRAESSQRAAVAIDVASADELARAGAGEAGGLNRVSPSVNVVRSGGVNTSFFIRGVGNFTNNSYSDPAVAFSLNGVYLGRPSSTLGTFFDLERVEVLKGPQGTLYGRNATGGAVNVIYRRPDMGDISGYASASYGNYDALELEAAINLPIGDKVATRISGKLVDRDGYNDDGTSDDKGEAFRAQILAEPSDNVSAHIVFDWAHVGGAGTSPSYLGRLAFSPGTPATATSPANYTFVPVPNTLDSRSGFHTPAAEAYRSTLVVGGAFINPAAETDYPFMDNTFWGVSGEFTADLGEVELTLIPAYRKSILDSQGDGPGFRNGISRETAEQFSVEARLNGSVGPVDWLLGGFHFNEDIDAENGFNQYFINSLQQFTTGTTSNAIFGRLTFNVADNFRLVGGARYTSDKKYFDNAVDTLLMPCTNAPPPGGPGCFGGPTQPPGTSLAEVAAQIPAALLPFGFPPAPGPANARPFGSSGNILFYTSSQFIDNTKKSRVTYRLAAEYDVGPASLLYASYETGFRSGGFSAALGRETYDPEYISAFTIGSKNRFLDNRLQVNVEGFYWRYRDQQISHLGFDINGGNSFFTENAGRSTIKGVDLDVQFKATPTTLLTGSVQYLDSKTKDFVYNVPRGPTALPPAVGCPFTTGTDNGLPVYIVDCSGKRGFNAPKWSINAGIEQRLELGGYELTFNGSGRYRSNRVLAFEYLPQGNSGSDVMFDASLSLAPTDEKWVLTGWVRNLTDETVPTTGIYVGTVGGTITSNYQPPRTYGLTARVNF
jgi:iron complex outermembrane receptor protein